MLTYGLVKQQGPYSKGGRSVWSPYARNTAVISPTVPTPMLAGYLEPSQYARRKLRKEGQVPQYTLPVINRPNELITLLKQLATFSGQFMADRPRPDRGTAPPRPGDPSTMDPNAPPVDPNAPATDPNAPDVKDETEPPIKTEDEETEEVQPLRPLGDLVEGDGQISRLQRGQFLNPALDLIRQGISRLNGLQLASYVNRVLPVVWYFVDTQQLTTEAALTLLVGNYARPMIRALRTGMRLRTDLTQALSDYAMQPTVRTFRDVAQFTVSQGINYIGDSLAQISDSQGTITPTATIWEPSTTEEMQFAAEMELIAQDNVGRRRNGITLLNALMQALRAQAMASIQVPTIQSITQASGTQLYGLRNTAARIAGPGFYNEGNIARRVFGRRSGFGYR